MSGKILGLTWLDAATYVLRLERGNYPFLPGQYAELGLPGSGLSREYSIYSPRQADYLEFLIRLIPGGAVSTALAGVRPGDFLELSSARGNFTLAENEGEMPLLFLATGTGISPFHSLCLSNPDLDYTLTHGSRSPEGCYHYADYIGTSPVSCLSRSSAGDFQGRVTLWLQQQDLSRWKRFFLCGNSDMIYQAFEILQDRGILREQVRVETYF